MYILLDIDGVMVPATSWKAPQILADGFPEFSKKAISSLNNILNETGATILLTTSHKSRFSSQEWQQIFRYRGINTSIEKLQDNVNSLTRSEEILNWVYRNSYIEDYVILDDDKSLNGLPFNVKERLVLTSPLIGLNEDDSLKAINILDLVSA